MQALSFELALAFKLRLPNSSVSFITTHPLALAGAHQPLQALMRLALQKAGVTANGELAVNAYLQSKAYPHIYTVSDAHAPSAQRALAHNLLMRSSG